MVRPDLRDPGSLKFAEKIGSLSLKTNDIVYPPQTYFNKPCRNLDVSDIEGARPKEKKSNGSRNTNPLDPVYTLPSYPLNEIPPPRFIRDNIGIGDIKGAQPPGPSTIKTRDHINKHDGIPKSTGGWRIRKFNNRPTRGANLDITDINNDLLGLNRFQPQNRQCNPLSPRYEYNTTRSSDLVKGLQRSKSAERIGSIKGNHPMKIFRDLHKPKDTSLKTGDITGATVVDPYRRTRPMVNPNDVADIKGAQAGSFKWFESDRRTIPLNPCYKLLDTPRGKFMLSKTAPLPTRANAGPAKKPPSLEKRRANETLNQEIAAVRGL